MSKEKESAGSERGNKENSVREPEPTEQQEEEQSENSKTSGRTRKRNSKQIKSQSQKLAQREEANSETEKAAGNGDLQNKFPRMRLFKNNEMARNGISKEEDDAEDLEIQPYDELFFCYVCKSIFVSKLALENHHIQDHNV